jgi:hypothetical protein
LSGNTTTQRFLFPDLFPKPVVMEFGSSDGGAILLKAAARRLRLTQALTAWRVDQRQSGKVKTLCTSCCWTAILSKGRQPTLRWTASSLPEGRGDGIRRTGNTFFIDGAKLQLRDHPEISVPSSGRSPFTRRFASRISPLAGSGMG